MNRRALKTGGWFNPETSRVFPESTYFDGHNHCSSATESQWDHETLYLTKLGHWILQRTSQRRGSVDVWEHIDVRTALQWLMVCGHDIPDGYEKPLAELEF